MIEMNFKESDLGLIPHDWEVKTLADVGTIRMCKRVMKYQTSESGDIPFYKIGTFGKQADAFISKELYNEFRSKYNYPKKGDILLSAAGTIGRTVVFDGKPAYFQDSNIVWIENNERLVVNSLLYYIYHRVNWVTDTGTIPRIYNGNVSAISFPLPPTTAEQERIADALSKIDSLITDLDALIEKKRAIKTGTMQQLLTGKKRLAGFTGEWKNVRLGDVTDIRTGKRNGDENVKNGQYPFFVRSQTIYRINTYSYDGEAILIPGEGGIGSIFHYINGKFDYHQRVYKISDFADGIYAKYVYFYMKYNFGVYAMQNTVKATVDSLRLPIFQDFMVSIPSTIAEQSAIAAVLSGMDTEIAALEQKRDKYIAIKSGMMQDLLTGKIRLV